MDQVEKGRDAPARAATEAETGEARAPAGRPVRSAPWPVAQRRGRHADEGLAVLDEAVPGLPLPGLPLFGVERRLVRRAEAVWEQLRPAGGLPPAAAIHAFETPMFTDSAMLCALPPHPLDPGCAAPRILRVGRKLVELGIRQTGPVTADGGARATLAARLAALVERATAQGGPVVVEIDSPGGSAGKRETGVLLRAIALPFASPATDAGPAGPVAVVIASWRTLLSAAETADLQRELAAALAWLRGTH